MIGKVMNMDKLARQALLYDFYGELLTEHQRGVYEEVVLNDFSLSEVAEDQGISRQGVHDLVKRSTKILEDYEGKLHLVEKFVTIREKVHEIHGLTQDYEGKDLKKLMNKIGSLSYRILEEL
ncbi:MAG: DNA-binding protein [Clostridia bacterium]|nr:DNA-binding protein [Clostridia bacterium]